MTASKEIRFGLRGALTIAVLAAAFIVPAQANADSCSNAGSDPTAAQYCPQVLPTSSSSNTPTSTFTASSSAQPSGSLPFTGFDVAALVAVAAVLTGTGLALWRLTNSAGNKA